MNFTPKSNAVDLKASSCVPWDTIAQMTWPWNTTSLPECSVTSGQQPIFDMLNILIEAREMTHC